MTLDEIKNYFCMNGQLIVDLENKLNEIKEKIKELTPSLMELVEYINYINCDSKEKQHKQEILFNTELGKEIRKLTNQYEDIKSKIDKEKEKIGQFEFDLINRKKCCDHLYYLTESGDKVCIKCACYNSEIFETEEQAEDNRRRNYNRKLLDIELSSYYGSRVKEGTMVSDFIQNESLDYVLEATLKFLKINPNISNEELQKRLELLIAKLNVDFIEDMYPNKNDMTLDVKKSYESYKKHL